MVILPRNGSLILIMMSPYLEQALLDLGIGGRSITDKDVSLMLF